MAKKRSRQQVIASQKLKEYRHYYSLAKKHGLVRGDMKAGSLKPSKYMKTKLNKLKPYLQGEYEFLKATTPKQRKTAQRFRNAPSEFVPAVFNNVIVGKKRPGAKLTFDDAILKRVRHLEAGGFEHIPLPIKAKNLEELEEYVRNNDYLNDVLKHEDEVFNFTIYGNKSFDSYGDLQALLADLYKYEAAGSVDDLKNMNFELYRSFKDWKHPGNTGARASGRQTERMREYRQRIASNPEKYRRYREYANAARRASYNSGYQDQLDRQKQKIRTETPEQREKRLKRARENAKKWRASKKTTE